MHNKELANYLLSVKAVELRPNNPFTWASGIKSPIYCDNRQLLSFPEIRTFLKKTFVDFIKSKYPDVQVIAGVATGAIAIGALIADALNLPFIYIRAKAKEHGRQNLIEGKFYPKSKVVVIEDLISTGGSSIAAVEALKEANGEILGLVAIFSYGFKIAKENFENANFSYDTLTDYHTLINIALEKKYIKENDLELLKSWHNQFI